MKKKTLAVLLFMGLCVGTASAQFGFGGIVYDPTNITTPYCATFNSSSSLSNCAKPIR